MTDTPNITTHFHGEVKGPIHTGSGDIHIEALSYGTDEQAITQLREDVLARLDAVQYQVVTNIVAQLRADQLQELQVILVGLDQLRLSQQEAIQWVAALRPALIEAEEKKLLPAASASTIVDSPTLGVAHKLKLTVPIIPFLLGYEGEIQLGSRMNLEMAWEWLKKKLGQA